VFTVASSLPPLLGRDAELKFLRSPIDQIENDGRTLVLRGEPGIGKSRLLAEVATLARERGWRILSATGVQSEAHLAFAGLHQLVRPVRSRIGGLPAPQRDALQAAFGIKQQSAPERFRIALAVLDLLCDVATDEPLLVLAEDAHWLDGPTAEALAFVARRVESDPIVVLAGQHAHPRSASTIRWRVRSFAHLTPIWSELPVGWAGALAVSVGLLPRALESVGWVSLVAT
jgi:predicted ATPase